MIQKEYPEISINEDPNKKPTDLIKNEIKMQMPSKNPKAVFNQQTNCWIVTYNLLNQTQTCDFPVEYCKNDNVEQREDKVK